MKRTLLTLLALTPLAAGAADKYWVNPTKGNTCYWVDGFSLDNPNTWNFDADKHNNIINDEIKSGITSDGVYLDGHYCWAASAANIIAQWEAKNVETVQATQNRAPKDAQDIFDEFVHTFHHASGETVNATNWYFNGTVDRGLQFKNGANTAGGFYKDKVEYETKYADPMFQENSGWTADEEGGFPTWNPDVYETQDLHKQWTTTLANRIEEGYSISIAADGVYRNDDGKLGYYSHALTLWGIEIDTEGYLTRMWLTDSDDATSHKNDMGLFSVSCKQITMQSFAMEYVPDPDNPGKQMLVPVYGNVDYFTMQSDIAREDGVFWYNAYSDEKEVGDYLSAYSAIKITSLAGAPNDIPNVPEPATGTLSLLALAALCARRKRK